MSVLLKLRRGTTAQHSTFTGASGEVTVDTTKKTLVVHDGTTAGGVPLATAGANTFTADQIINGVKVGRGAGSVSTNTAVGASALNANTSGANNTAVGYQAGYGTTTSADNTAVGAQALYTNSTGARNAAFGRLALHLSTTAGDNSAFGYGSLYATTTGQYNTALGRSALENNTTAGNNTAVGYQAGYSNTTGAANLYVGNAAGYSSTGSNNTFVGGGGTTACGYYMTTGSKNTILGGYSGNQGGLDIRTASNVIVLSDGDGNPRYYYNSGHYVTGINSGAGTYAMKWSSATGQITYDTSSARYKDNIRDSVYGLEAVMQIRSAQFEYKDDGRQDVGLIAEEVFEVIPELVALDADGNPNAVSYDRFVSVCIKAIQELKAEFDAYKEAHP